MQPASVDVPASVEPASVDASATDASATPPLELLLEAAPLELLLEPAPLELLLPPSSSPPSSLVVVLLPFVVGRSIDDVFDGLQELTHGQSVSAPGRCESYAVQH